MLGLGFHPGYELELLERHPLRYFFHEMRQTDGVVNSMLTLLGVGAIVWPVMGRLPWLFVVVGVLLLWQVVRNYRRYVERVHFAIAERDRAGIEPPTHPDHR
jgi:hypothetical protein